MKRKNILIAVMIGVALPAGVMAGDETDGETEAIFAGDSVCWSLPSGYSGGDLSVGGPARYTKHFGEGEEPCFSAVNADGDPYPDGVYSYAVSFQSAEGRAFMEKLDAAREKENSTEFDRLDAQYANGEAFPALEESGQFRISGGTVEKYDGKIAAVEAEEESEAANRAAEDASSSREHNGAEE